MSGPRLGRRWDVGDIDGLREGGGVAVPSVQAAGTGERVGAHERATRSEKEGGSSQRTDRSHGRAGLGLRAGSHLRSAPTSGPGRPDGRDRGEPAVYDMVIGPSSVSWGLPLNHRRCRGGRRRVLAAGCRRPRPARKLGLAPGQVNSLGRVSNRWTWHLATRLTRSQRLLEVRPEVAERLGPEAGDRRPALARVQRDRLGLQRPGAQDQPIAAVVACVLLERGEQRPGDATSSGLGAGVDALDLPVVADVQERGVAGEPGRPPRRRPCGRSCAGSRSGGPSSSSGCWAIRSA